MSDPKAMLVYGFALGRRGEWQLEEAPANEYSERPELECSWYSDHEVGGHFDDLLYEQLYNAMPTDLKQEDTSWKQERAAKQHYGVGLHFHGSENGLGRILGTRVISVEWGETWVVAPAELAKQNWEDAPKLKRAIEILGITPTQGEPGWILASLYF